MTMTTTYTIAWGPTLELELPARFRRAARLPYLKPWSNG
jgi:hypothetical protein